MNTELKFFTPTDVLEDLIKNDIRLTKLCEKINTKLKGFSLTQPNVVFQHIQVYEGEISDDELAMVRAVYKKYGWRIRITKDNFDGKITYQFFATEL